MFTPEELRNLTFNKSMHGYRTEEVDAFLEEVSEQISSILREKDEMEDKLFILAEKIEDYRADEEMVKTTLINAQRLGENVIHEAKVKADVIIRDANARAERITETAEASIQSEQLALNRLRSEVSSFKNEVLTLYKEHINLLSTLSEDVADADIQESPSYDDDIDVIDENLNTTINEDSFSISGDTIPFQPITNTSVTEETDPFQILDETQEKYELGIEEDFKF